MDFNLASNPTVEPIWTVSQKSVDRVERLIKRVAQPYTCVHQVLTFPEQLFELSTAKGRLKKLLDVVHKKFETGTIYVFERHHSQAWHIHAMFFFFANDSAPPVVPSSFSKAVFAEWKQIHKGKKCFSGANKSSIYPEASADYLLKSVKVGPSTKRRSANWWGYRNKQLLDAHKGPPLPKVRRKKWKGQLTPRVVWHWEFEEPKRNAEKQGISWAVYKRRTMKRSIPVSDKQFLEYLRTLPIQRRFPL